MKSVIQWAVRNGPAMNTLMVSAIVVGLFCLTQMRREVFPEFDLEIILVSVPYPGASPDEVEEGICQKIEEAVRPIEGIKQQVSIAQEGAGFVVIELEADIEDVQKTLNEVRSEVDRIPSFPELAEEREVKQITMRQPVISVGILGPQSDDPESDLRLRDIAERVRDDLLHQPAVSQASIVGAREYQIDIEIPEETLRKYGLTLQQVAQIVSPPKRGNSRRHHPHRFAGSAAARQEQTYRRRAHPRHSAGDLARRRRADRRRPGHGARRVRRFGHLDQPHQRIAQGWPFRSSGPRPKTCWPWSPT